MWVLLSAQLLPQPSHQATQLSRAIWSILPFFPSQRTEALFIHSFTYSLIQPSHRHPLDLYSARHRAGNMCGTCFHQHKFNYILFWKVLPLKILKMSDHHENHDSLLLIKVTALGNVSYFYHFQILLLVHTCSERLCTRQNTKIRYSYCPQGAQRERKG